MSGNSLPISFSELKQILERVIHISQSGMVRVPITKQEGKSGEELLSKDPLDFMHIGNTKIEMPPSRDSLGTLFKYLNLKVTPEKVTEALFFCRGPLLEMEDPDSFDFDKLVRWLAMNVQTLKHRDMTLVDPSWIQRVERRKQMASLNMPKPNPLPNPLTFLKKNKV